MSSNRGFTLVELLTVVVIIGILAAIAIPNYADYVTRSKIPEATSALSTMRGRMEQYFQDNRTYVGACVTTTIAPLPANTTNFNYSCSNLAVNTYTVTATGVNSMNGFVFTVNQSNVRATTGAPTGWTTSGNCWITGKGGTCQ